MKRGWMRWAHWMLVVAAISTAVDASAATLQSWVVTARIRSGNTTLTDSPDPPNPPMPTDASGFLEANGANIGPPSPPIDAGAAAEYDLPNGTVGVTSGFDATSNFPDDLRIFDPYGGTSTTYIDEVSVVSSTLSPGTPVTLRFVYDLAWDALPTSSLGLATVAADIQSLVAGMSLLSSNSDRYFYSLDGPTLIHGGLFTGDQHAEFLVDSTVGSVLSFTLQLGASSYGTVYVTGGVGNETNHTAAGWSSAAVSFGGEVVGADATLESALLGGPFPGASAVSPAMAEGALPMNPFVPEPGVAAGCGAALWMLGWLRKRARRGKG